MALLLPRRTPRGKVTSSSVLADRCVPPCSLGLVTILLRLVRSADWECVGSGHLVSDLTDRTCSQPPDQSRFQCLCSLIAPVPSGCLDLLS